MTGRHAALLTTILLLFSLHQISVADDQDFSISRSLDLWNEEPCAAVNTETGDVLVVWCRLDLNNRKRSYIYAALCKLQGDGSFKVRRPRLISGKKDACSDPFTAYDPESNSFLVVWRINRDAPILIRADTQARMVNGKGKTVGGIVELFKTDDRHEYELVLAPVPQTVRDIVPGSAYLLSWELSPQDAADFAKLAGLWTVMLDEKGDLVSTPNRIMKTDFTFNPSTFGEATPYRILATGNGTFYLTMIYVRVDGGDRIQETYIIKLDERGQYAGKVMLDSGNTPMNTSIALLSKKRLLASWYNFDELKCRNQLLKSTLKKKKGSYSPVSGNSSTSELVGLADGGAFQIITTYPNFQTARFDSKGKMQGGCVQHNPSSSFPGDFTAVEVRGTNRLLLVWRRSVGGGSTEILGRLLNVN
jgi:hypothetical protein